MPSHHVSSVLQTAREKCASTGARLTQKRLKLLETLAASSTPLSAYELAERYRDMHDAALPPMSVYRILEFLEDKRLVHRLNLNNKYIACAQIRCCQEHAMSQFMICTQCNKVEEALLPSSVVAQLDEQVTQAGFSLAGPHLELACICRDCETAQAHTANN